MLLLTTTARERAWRLLKISSSLIGWFLGFPPILGVFPWRAPLRFRTLYIVEVLRTESRCFFGFEIRTVGWQGPSSSIAKVWRVKKKACQTTRNPWGLGLYTVPWRWRLFSHSPVGRKKLFSKLVFTWRSNCSRGPFEEMWCADIEKWVADLAVEGLLFVKVSTKLDIHSLLTGSAAGPLAWSEIDPAHRAFDARGPTKPNFQRPDRAGQRCKCRLVCEWVCTVTSVSVRIEKRANCAKNNKPKSGGLFLVNARPFPEHSSSIATFSAGRAWLEASRHQI